MILHHHSLKQWFNHYYSKRMTFIIIPWNNDFIIFFGWFSIIVSRNNNFIILFGQFYIIVSWNDDLIIIIVQKGWLFIIVPWNDNFIIFFGRFLPSFLGTIFSHRPFRTIFDYSLGTIFHHHSLKQYFPIIPLGQFHFIISMGWFFYHRS